MQPTIGNGMVVRMRAALLSRFHAIRPGYPRALVALGLALLVAGCTGGGYTWGWYVVMPTTDEGRTNFFYLIAGFGYTLQLTASASASAWSSA